MGSLEGGVLDLLDVELYGVLQRWEGGTHFSR